MSSAFWFAEVVALIYALVLTLYENGLNGILADEMGLGKVRGMSAPWAC